MKGNEGKGGEGWGMLKLVWDGSEGKMMKPFPPILRMACASFSVVLAFHSLLMIKYRKCCSKSSSKFTKGATAPFTLSRPLVPPRDFPVLMSSHYPSCSSSQIL